jgi:23S rRNA pseudouridine2604 synthase
MVWTRLYEEDEPQRVNRWLAHNDVCSRREAEALIAKGLVSIDGETVQEAGRKIERGQTLTVADDASVSAGGPLTVVLNKPVGVVSGQPEPGEVPAIRLLTPQSLWADFSGATPGPDSRLPPAGRLDKDSHGLLILSEDGVVAKAVIGPTSEVDKEYLVRVSGTLNNRKIRMLRHGLRLDGRDLKPARVDVVEGQLLRFVLKEGRNRQIRRMCDLVELVVADLQRIRVGPVLLGDLPEGRWRPMTAAERTALIQAGQGGVSPSASRQATS